MGCRGGGANLDKRNLFDKRNVVVESMAAEGGEILIKGRQVGPQMTAWAAQGVLIKGMFFHKRNVVVESMGCRGGGKF